MTRQPPPADRLVLRPRRLVAVCWAVAVLVVVVFGVLALLLDAGSSGTTQFRAADQVAFFGIGVLLAAVPVALTRVRVVADARGVWVRNGLGERFLPWGVVAGVELPEHASWAQLVLRDDDTLALLALQSNDGERAVEGVLALRRLLARSRAS